MLKNIKKRLKEQKGFTLVELLAVIVILGIIAAIAIPSIGGIIQKSKEDAAKADAIQLINAAKNYVASNGIPTTDLTEKELESYIDNVSLENDYKITVTSDDVKTTFKLTGSAVVSKATITFTGAEIKDINSDKGKGTREIKGS